jgi:hypothetical protein
MQNLFKIISRAIGGAIEKVFRPSQGGVDVWIESFSNVRLQLNECIGIIVFWSKAITNLQ